MEAYDEPIRETCPARGPRVKNVWQEMANYQREREDARRARRMMMALLVFMVACAAFAVVALGLMLARGAGGAG